MSWLDAYQPLNGVRLNMISTSSGEFVGANGSSREISNQDDRELILRLRTLADVYVTGGNTFRSEKYKVPTKGQLAVISRKKDHLPDSVLQLGPYSENLPQEALAQLGKNGFRRILLEVGPELAKQFLSADCVDEFCLTIPNGSPEDATKIVRLLESDLVLMDVTFAGETLFSRWRRGND